MPRRQHSDPSCTLGLTRRSGLIKGSKLTIDLMLCSFVHVLGSGLLSVCCIYRQCGSCSPARGASMRRCHH